ncbi:MAG: cytochrome c [Candidatus Kapaibacterium sp.]
MKLLVLITLAAAMALFTSCGGGGGDEGKTEAASGADKGIGPIKTVFVGNLDAALASNGEKIFNSKCSACHKVDERYVGPSLRGVSKKRTPEWIMNMIMNPEQMIKENEEAKKLYAEFMTPMANQNIPQDEARALLEYLRSLDQ